MNQICELDQAPSLNLGFQRNQTNETHQTNRCRYWFALRTKARHEKQVRDRLEAHGVEPLLPVITRLSQWKDRRKEVEFPLFSGYCFARFQWDERIAVANVTGVVAIVGAGSRPEQIPDEEIAAIRALMSSRLTYGEHPYLEEGMLVEVTRGPLEGLRGILVRREKRHRLVLSVHVIKQAAAVEIDDCDVVPVS
jgi:transcription antitermination factor NusG